MDKMIYRKYSTNVLLKKVSLKLWCLEDEVSETIKNQLEFSLSQAGDKKNLDLLSLKDSFSFMPLEFKVEEGQAPSLVTEELSPEESQEERQDQIESSTKELEQELEKEQIESVEIIQLRRELPDAIVFNGNVFLYEFGLEEMYFFTEKKFLIGQLIQIEFLVPQRFMLLGEVQFCWRYSNSAKIIGNKFNYRGAVKFLFVRKGERTFLRNFLLSLDAPVMSISEVNTEGPLEDVAKDDDELDIDDLGI